MSRRLALVVLGAGLIFAGLVPIAPAQTEGTADLAITRFSDSPDPVQVGADLTYTVEVKNLGPASAGPFNPKGVVLVGLLPAGSTHKSSKTTSGDCSPPGVVPFSCNFGVMEAGDSAKVEITITPNQPGRAVASMTVYNNNPTVPDPIPSNNQASSETTVGGLVPTPGADLSVTIKDQPDPVRASGEILYTVTVSNGGPANAQYVEVRSQSVATSARYKRSSATKGSCSGTDTSFVCQIAGGLMAGGSAEFFVVVTAPDREQTVFNAVTVRGDVTDVDPNPVNNQASTTTAVQGGSQGDTGADLSLTLRDNPDPVQRGENFTYTMTVTNEGPAASLGGSAALITRGATFARSEVSPPSGGGCDTSAGSTANCRTGPLGPRDSEVFTLIASANADATHVTGVAELFPSNESFVTDLNLTNNVAIETTIVSGTPALGEAAELALAIEDDPDPVKATKELTYSLVVHNAGAASASNVVVNDLLPAGVSFRSASPGCQLNATVRVVTCQRDSLAAGGRATMSIVVRTERSGTISNAARVDSTTPDPDLGNNQQSEPTTVEPAADVALTKTATPNPVAVGEDLTYGLAAANGGPDAAQGVRVTDQLPVGVNLKSASNECSFDASSRIVTCALGNLASGGSGRATITMVPTEPGDVSSTAKATALTFDPDPSDNEATVATRADCGAEGCPLPDLGGGDPSGGSSSGGGGATGNATDGGSPRGRAPGGNSGGRAGGPPQGSPAPANSSGGTASDTPAPATTSPAGGQPPPPVSADPDLALSPGKPLELSGPPVLEPLPSGEASSQVSLPLSAFAMALLFVVSIPTFRLLKGQYPGGLRLPRRLALRRG